MKRPQWRELGLTGNPFENILPGQQLDWVDVPTAVHDALQAKPFVIQLIGEKGAGKSTLLRWYAATHADAHYHYADVSLALKPEAETARVLCLDEANKASPAAVKALAARAAARNQSLFISTHHSLERVVPGVKTFELAGHEALGWVARRVAAVTLEGAQAFDFLGIARDVYARTSRVNYAVQRVLYELAENLARGVEVAAALDDAFRRAREDETVAPLINR